MLLPSFNPPAQTYRSPGHHVEGGSLAVIVVVQRHQISACYFGAVAAAHPSASSRAPAARAAARIDEP
jgi:hypothetical protein